MKQTKAKLFIKRISTDIDITCMPIDESIEYYSFLKECHGKGFRQVIVTSEIMIKIINYFVLKEAYKIYNIEFMESDDSLDAEIESLLDIISKFNSNYLNLLLEKIYYLSENSSIDIKRIYFKGRNSKNEAVNFYIQSNGILGIDIPNFSRISQIIVSIVKQSLS